MSEEDKLTELSEVSKSNLSMMTTIASNNQTIDDIKMLTSSKVTDQLKVFLVSQARNELLRIIKLTKFLDKLESSFMNKTELAIVEDELTLKQYGEVISVITSLLNRSNDIVSKVLNDDSLMTILNTTVYSDTSGSELKSTSVISSLKDAQSRARVREVLKQVIVRVDEVANIPNNNNEVTDIYEEVEGGEDPNG